MEPLKLCGYSERGMINALCYEMCYSPDSLRLVREFLNLFTFPFSKPDFEGVESATFVVEQSFSDFGDLDLLILLNGSKKQAVLLEAKVKTSQTNDWSIVPQWAAFCDLPKATAQTSNLFMQLYRKMRLIEKIRSDSEAVEPNDRMPRASLGQNLVVASAVEQLKPYCSQTWFVALVPENKDRAQQFFERELPKPIDAPGWDHRTMGFVTWEEVEEHMLERPEDWPHTLQNFERNKGQIYGPAVQAVEQRPPPPGSPVSWLSGSECKTGVVKNRGRLNTRVALTDSASEKVANNLLEPVNTKVV